VSAIPRLSGRRALVTGGSGGIGLATARRFVAEGATVAICDRDVARVPDGIQAIEADVTSPEAMAAAVELAAGGEQLDVCVANAGVLLVEPFVTSSPREWERVLRVNTLGVMITFQAAARHMTQRGVPGRLLATASISGLRGESNALAYCASKAAVVSIVESLAAELAPSSITVNAVAPGEIDTDMNTAAMAQLGAASGVDAKEYRERLVSSGIPLGRMGQPSDVAAAFAFLASDDASYITGMTMRVDGGQLLL
jgi:NAD(P)-dependent dehydrogenase (short-subunit alcohol dehydrogenase family)